MNEYEFLAKYPKLLEQVEIELENMDFMIPDMEMIIRIVKVWEDMRDDEILQDLTETEL